MITKTAEMAETLPASPSTSHRLDFNKIKRSGREEELAFLKTLLQQVVRDTKAASLIIESDSGMGKSYFIEQFVKNVNSQKDDMVWICRGKFEETLACACEPFAAIIEAVDMLVDQILHSGEQVTWTNKLREELNAELDLLFDIVPAIRRLDVTFDQNDSFSSLDSDAPLSFDGFGNVTVKEWRFERFRLALRSLFRCISIQRPVVLILDDFHWVDPDSLKIVQTLLEDSSPGRMFLFLATSRPISGFENLHCLLGSSYKLQLMTLPRLSSCDIASLLVDVLCRSSADEVIDLAKVIQEKTGGNAFIVIQFIRLLEQKGHLFFSPEEELWNWDLRRISRISAISDDVTKVVAETLTTVDKKLRSALIVAAAFGVSHFEVSTIVHAVTVLSGCDDEDDPSVVKEGIRIMKGHLREAVKDGYIEELVFGRSYKFAHDRIREAAYSLLPDGHARRELHLKIGRKLRSWIDMQEELGLSQDFSSAESLLLHAAKQLNAGSALMDDPWEKLDLADLNYQAAEIAAKKTSFHSAIEYLQKGLSHLGTDSWTSHYELKLKLSVALSRMQYCCGLCENSVLTADTVIEHAKAYRDKRSAYYTKVFCLYQLGRFEEAMQLVLSVLDLLGEPFPRKHLVFHIAKDMVMIRRQLRNLSDKDILGLPKARDEFITDCTDFTEFLAEISYLGDFHAYSMLLPLRFIQLILKKGHVPISGAVLAVWGTVNVVKGDLSEADRFGRLAHVLAERYQSSHPGKANRGIWLKWFCLSHWNKPFRDGLAQVSKSFANMATSDVDYYINDRSVLSRLMFICGEPLELVATECRKFAESLIDYNQKSVWNHNASLLQTVFNLQGYAADPTVLTGEFVDEVLLKADCERTTNKGAQFQFYFFKTLLAYHFYNFELAVNMLEQMGQENPIDGPFIAWKVFYSALAYFAMYKKTRKNFYRFRSRPLTSRMRKWVEKGAVNYVYMDCLLLAEKLSCTVSSGASVAAVKDAYDKAIQVVAPTGLIHHHALANELAGTFFVNRSEFHLAATYITRAAALYQEWGAIAKVDDLKSRYTFAWEQGHLFTTEKLATGSSSR